MSASTSRTNHIARAIDATIEDLDTYHHSQVSLAAREQSVLINLNVTQAAVLYLKATLASDGTPIEIIAELDGLDSSVSTGEVKVTEMVLLNTDVIAVRLSNDNDVEVLVEIIAAGA